MICPRCGSDSEMAYSILSNGFICLESSCGYEVEMTADEAQKVFHRMEELICA
jgi:hypothetical protein